MADHARLIATVGEDRVSLGRDNAGGGGAFHHSSRAGVYLNVSVLPTYCAASALKALRISIFNPPAPRGRVTRVARENSKGTLTDVH